MQCLPSGDPIADSFALCYHGNNALVVVADGVNWGEQSRLASRCAVHGCFHYIHRRLFSAPANGTPQLATTKAAVQLLLESFSVAHSTILSHGRGLTTLCAALVLPLAPPAPHPFGVVSVNLGDSLAFVLSPCSGLRELTIGSHDTSAQRDIRDTGGALGPVGLEDQPELHNLTCSLTGTMAGDVLLLTSDGLSDNFDPIVNRIAVVQSTENLAYADDDDEEESSKTALPPPPQQQRKLSVQAPGEEILASRLNLTQQLELSAWERHNYTLKEMERVWHELELVTPEEAHPEGLCRALIQEVMTRTADKRALLEQPKLFRIRRKNSTPEARDLLRREVSERLRRIAGKLDHAAIAACEIGLVDSIL